MGAEHAASEASTSDLPPSQASTSEASPSDRRSPRPRVLVLRFSSVGDIVLTSAAVDALAQAWPEAHICFVTKPAYADLMRPNPQIHEVITFAPGESTLALRRRLLALAPTAVLDLHGKIRGLVLRSIVSPRQRVRWRQRPWYQSLAVRLKLSTYHARMTIAARYHEAVERLVGRQLPPGRLRHFVSDEARLLATRTLTEAGLDLSRTIVGMAPGALWETKRWPVESFAALAAHLRVEGKQVVLTGSATEAPLTAAIVRAAPGAVDLAGKLPLAALGGIIDACAAFVANDSGPMHIARALGVPTVAFFGSTDPRQFSFAGHALMFADAPCSPCSLHGLARCPKGHLDCLRRISPDAVHERLTALLTEPHKRAFLSA